MARPQLARSSIQDYPEPIKDTKRPFRWWDTEAKKYLPYHYYSDVERAKDGAFLYTKRWAHAGTCIEVLDVRFSRWMATYRRGVHEVQYSERGKLKVVK